MIAKIKSFINRNRYAVMTAVMSFMLACSAFAVDDTGSSSFDLTTVMSTSVQKIVNDLLAMITAVLPTAIILFSASVGITYAIRFIKKILGKAN